MKKFLKPAGVQKNAQKAIETFNKIAVTCMTMHARLEATRDRIKKAKPTKKDFKELDYQIEQFDAFAKTFARWKWLPQFKQVPRNFKINADRIKLFKRDLLEGEKPDMSLIDRVLGDLKDTGEGTLDAMTEGWGKL